jgi:hypothetical protein
MTHRTCWNSCRFNVSQHTAAVNTFLTCCRQPIWTHTTTSTAGFWLTYSEYRELLYVVKMKSLLIRDTFLWCKIGESMKLSMHLHLLEIKNSVFPPYWHGAMLSTRIILFSPVYVIWFSQPHSFSATLGEKECHSVFSDANSDFSITQEVHSITNVAFSPDLIPFTAYSPFFCGRHYFEP